MCMLVAGQSLVSVLRTVHTCLQHEVSCLSCGAHAHRCWWQVRSSVFAGELCTHISMAG